MGLIKKIYDWVLGLAQKPNGDISLGILSFSEASFFPIPQMYYLYLFALEIERRYTFSHLYVVAFQ